MNGPWVHVLDGWAGVWASGIVRASWQGGMAVALAWALCHTVPALPPRVRCWLWRLAYLKLLVALVWFAPVELPLLAARAIGDGRPAASDRRPVLKPDPALLATGPLSGREGQQRCVPAGSLSPTPVALTRFAGTGLSPALLLLWLVGAGWCAARVVREWGGARRLRCRCRPAREGELTEVCEALCGQLGLRVAPRLLIDPEAGSPALLGWLQPTLLLPAPLVARSRPGELKLILAHELAHLKRRDLQWGWLPVAAHLLFYFHPLVWLANREWRLAQELAADELAILATGAPLADYGKMLVRVAALLRRRSRLGLATIGVLESPRTLRRRLRAMPHIRPLSRRTLLLSGALLAAAGLALLVPWRLTARAAPARQQGSPAARLRPPTPQRRTAGLSRTAAAAAAIPSSSPPVYFHTAMFVNNTGQIALRSDLLNVPMNLDLRQVPLREALRRICGPTHQGYTMDANVPADQRVTVRGQRIQVFRALDQVIRQAGGGWMQEMRNGKPIIRVGRGLFLTTHTGPLKLPRDRPFLKQVGAIAHLTAGTAGSAAR